MRVGERIKKIRTKRGISQKDIANALHIDVSAVCRWERNQRNVPEAHLRRLSDFLGVSIGSLDAKDGGGT